MKFDINRMDPPSDEASSIFSQKPEIKVDNSYFNEFHNFFPLVFNVPTKTNPDKVLRFIDSGILRYFSLMNHFRWIIKRRHPKTHPGFPTVPRIILI